MIFKRTCANCKWNKVVLQPEKACWECEEGSSWTRRRWVTLLTIILAVALILGAAFALTCWLASIDPTHNTMPSGREVPRTIVLTDRHYVRLGKHPRWIVTRATVIDFYRDGYRMTEVGR